MLLPVASLFAIIHNALGIIPFLGGERMHDNSFDLGRKKSEESEIIPF